MHQETEGSSSVDVSLTLDTTVTHDDFAQFKVCLALQLFKTVAGLLFSCSLLLEVYVCVQA